jgi:hypothetical protein
LVSANIPDVTEAAPPPSPGWQRAGPLALILVLLVAVALRWGVVVAIPSFFGSGDPSVYYAMGRSCAREGVPRIGFIWHLLTSPRKIEHVEDYCEPAFGYLLAVPLSLGGGTVTAAKALSVTCGTLAVLLVYLFARRFGPPVALLAAAFVALEPWSIYYGGLIMKEATVSVVLVAFLEIVRRLLARASAPPILGAGIGLLTVVASLIQYELLPILTTATAITLAFRSRPLLWPYLAGAAAGSLVLLAATWWGLGVPISAKLYYFLGRSPWDPLPGSGGITPAALSRFFPLRDLVVAAVASWYPVALMLALLGSRDPRVPRAEATLLVTFCLSYLYFHAVPGDVWKRDFIPATAVLAPYTALATIRAGSGWQARRWAPACAGALLAFALVGPHVYAAADALLPTTSAARRWLAVSILAGTAALAFAALYRARRLLPAARMRPLIPGLLVLALAINDHASLPWPAIYHNPQMPGYEPERARRERVCKRFQVLLAGRPVMTGHPAEVSLYAGVPSVGLPGDVPTILAVRTRYRVPFLLVGAGQLRGDVIARLPVEALATSEQHTLYRFLVTP